jgi:hypothetical protein
MDAPWIPEVARRFMSSPQSQKMVAHWDHEPDRPRSADWQSAVSPVGNRRPSRLPIGATNADGSWVEQRQNGGRNVFERESIQTPKQGTCHFIPFVPPAGWFGSGDATRSIRDRCSYLRCDRFRRKRARGRIAARRPETRSRWRRRVFVPRVKTRARPSCPRDGGG